MSPRPIFEPLAENVIVGGKSDSSEGGSGASEPVAVISMCVAASVANTKRSDVAWPRLLCGSSIDAPAPSAYLIDMTVPVLTNWKPRSSPQRPRPYLLYTGYTVGSPSCPTPERGDTPVPE